MSEEPLSEDLAEVEGLLRSLEPTASHVDFARAMYLAGRASAQAAPPRRSHSRTWLWPYATAASLLVAVAFASLWGASRKPRIVEHVVHVGQNGAPNAAPHVASVPPPVAKTVPGRHNAPGNEEAGEIWNEYVSLRQAVLTRGLEGLPKVQWRSPPRRFQDDWDEIDDPLVRQFLRG